MARATTDKAYENYMEDPSDETYQKLIQELMLHAQWISKKILREVAPQAVNMALEKALKGLDKFKGDCKFSTWFQKIAMNATYGWRQKKRSLDNYGTKKIVPLEGDVPRLFTRPDAETNLLLEDVIKNLPPFWAQKLKEYMWGEALTVAQVWKLKKKFKEILYGGFK